jgi:hypothetical protein
MNPMETMKQTLKSQTLAKKSLGVFTASRELAASKELKRPNNLMNMMINAAPKNINVTDQSEVKKELLNPNESGIFSLNDR